MDQCTFNPKLKSKYETNQQKKRDNRNVFDSLYDRAKQNVQKRVVKKQELKNEIEKELMD